MDQREYLHEFKQITDHMLELTRRKNTDYTGDASDPFKNFKAAPTLGVSTVEEGIFVRMTDKMSRLAGFIRNGKLLVEDEKIEDTLEDLAVYSIILAIYLRNERHEQRKRQGFIPGATTTPTSHTRIGGDEVGASD